MPGVIIRGDFEKICIQRYSFIDENTIIRPSYTNETPLRYIPLMIGKYTKIGKNNLIESATIGRGCVIGDNCILSSRTILKDYVRVEDNTVVPPDMVVPPFSVIAGSPARIVADVVECQPHFIEFEAKSRFKMFKKI